MAEEKLQELSYEKIAMSGGEMPDGLEWYDQQMFLNLRWLYHQYKSGIISRETAHNEKRKMLNIYDSQKWQHNLTKDIAKKIVSTEAARQAYRKNRTLENADAIILAFEGVPVTFNEDAL